MDSQTKISKYNQQKSLNPIDIKKAEEQLCELEPTINRIERLYSGFIWDRDGQHMSQELRLWISKQASRLETVALPVRIWRLKQYARKSIGRILARRKLDLESKKDDNSPSTEQENYLEPELNFDGDPESIPTPDQKDVAEEVLHQIFYHKYVLPVLNALPERQRIAIVDYYLYEKPVKETAQLLEVSHSRVIQYREKGISTIRLKLKTLENCCSLT